MSEEPIQKSARHWIAATFAHYHDRGAAAELARLWSRLQKRRHGRVVLRVDGFAFGWWEPDRPVFHVDWIIGCRPLRDWFRNWAADARAMGWDLGAVRIVWRRSRWRDSSQPRTFTFNALNKWIG